MYIDHYGLNGQPFQLTPDARFWFESRTHRKAMAYLGYGLAQGEGFIVVTGEIGAGKSTLVAHLMATIDRARLNAISLVSTQVEGDDMLRLAAQGLGIATGAVEKARLLDAVEQRLEQEHARRQAHAADRRRGAEPARLGARRAAHALQFPDRRQGAAPDRPARPARVPRQARLAGPRAAAPARHRHPSSRGDGRGRGRGLYPPPAQRRRLAGTSPISIRAPLPPSMPRPAAFRAGSTSSPTGCCFMPQSKTRT